MVLEEGYSNVLNNFLKDIYNKNIFLNTTKEILGYGLYLIPFYGIYDQYKLPKEKRDKAKVIFSNMTILGFAAKFATIPAYFLIKDVVSKNSNIVQSNNKQNTEQIDINTHHNCIEEKTKKPRKLEEVFDYNIYLKK